MASDTLSEIINSCLTLEKTAEDIFTVIASRLPDPEQQKFWRGVAAGTCLHRTYTAKTDLTVAETLPFIFFQPYEVTEEFNSIAKNAEELLEQFGNDPTMDNALLLGYRLQLALLHPAFANVFLLAKGTNDDNAHENAYDRYLQEFVNGIGNLGHLTPERQIINEALLRLWSETRQLAQQTHTDALTGVLNRAGFFKTVTPLAYAAQRNACNVGILLLDIDYFKLFGDTFGHVKGDAMIQTVASVVDMQMRRSDVVARYDGDEFIVFLSPVEENAILGIAENLRSKIESETEKRMVPITVSIGVAQGVLGENVEEDLEILIKKADDGQMKAKYAGKNRVAMKEEKKRRGL